MSQETEQQPDDVQKHLRDVQDLLERHALVEDLLHRQQMPKRDLVESLVHRQNLAELQKKLDSLHSADIAYILEALPLEKRYFVWDLVKSSRDGDILLEVSDAVRESLIESMAPEELKAAMEDLDVDELADLAPDMPPEVVQEVFQSLDAEERQQLRTAMSYPEDTVGALMDFDMVTVRDDVSLEVVLRYLRRFDELPDHTDKLFVVSRDEHLLGVLTLEILLISDPEKIVADVMRTEMVSFNPNDEASEAAQAFERYDLVSAPVVDEDRRLIARLTVADMVDYIREESEAEILGQAGLKEGEDIFAPVIDSFKNRWGWLAVNLMTAFFASRVIGAFEGSIEKLVALATLMTIVSGLGGNSGNQTITMIVRGIATGQIDMSAFKSLLKKETGVALMNGLAWGGLLGVISAWLYDNVALGVVTMMATTLNLLLAATAGVMIPMLRFRFGLDPAAGGSVLITALTDSGGFCIFLGLATLFLL